MLSHMPSPRRVRGALLRLVRRRWLSAAIGLAFVIPAAWVEFGGRYWYSSGKTQKNLFGIPSSDLVSRLTYSGLTGHAGELRRVYGRVAVTFGGWGFSSTDALLPGDRRRKDFRALKAKAEEIAEG